MRAYHDSGLLCGACGCRMVPSLAWRGDVARRTVECGIRTCTEFGKRYLLPSIDLQPAPVTANA